MTPADLLARFEAYMTKTGCSEKMLGLLLQDTWFMGRLRQGRLLESDSPKIRKLEEWEFNLSAPKPSTPFKKG